jgi:hypothetical protein
MNQAKGHGKRTANALCALTKKSVVGNRAIHRGPIEVPRLSYSTVEGAAKLVGIGNVTAWKWCKDPEFAERYRKATREAMLRSRTPPCGRIIGDSHIM